MNFISIDGDDVGSKLATAYLENDEVKLTETITQLDSRLTKIRRHLEGQGLEVIFYGADGVVCKGETLDVELLAEYIASTSSSTLTFSVGVGPTLQAAYFALKYAKATGKNKIVKANGDQSLTFNRVS